MKAVFKLVNGAVQRPRNSGVSSLEEAQKNDRMSEAYHRMASDFAVISDHIETLAGLDGGTERASFAEPSKPAELGFVAGLFPSNKARHKEALADHKAEHAKWKTGGIDLAPAEGTVVSTEDRNRFSANAELRFEPTLEFPEKEGEVSFAQGLGHVEADFEFGNPRNNQLRTTRSKDLLTPESLNYSRSGDVESYHLVESRWMRSEEPALRRFDLGPHWEKSGGTKSVQLKINHETQTVTYSSDDN